MATLLQVNSISKRYPIHQVEALKSISFELSSGDSLAFMGASGSGKTTLLNLLGLIDTPDTGNIVFEQQEVSSISENVRNEIRRTQIGFVFQFFNLIQTLTVFENVALPLAINRVKDKQVIRHQVNTLLEQVGLTDRATFFPHQLSGGQMQRAAIARALVHRPKLLIADEPTGNLDSETGHQILNLLTACCKNSGQSLIMATHSLEAANMCDRIFNISDGMLV